MRFLMQLHNMEEKGITTANSNLHPVGVYLALVSYEIRRWSLTHAVAQSLHKSLVPVYGCFAFVHFAQAIAHKTQHPMTVI